jgi:titin
MVAESLWISRILIGPTGLVGLPANDQECNAKDTSYCLQKLVENVDYFFRVSAENKVGISEPLEMDQPITIKSPYGRLCLA